VLAQQVAAGPVDPQMGDDSDPPFAKGTHAHAFPQQRGDDRLGRRAVVGNVEDPTASAAGPSSAMSKITMLVSTGSTPATLGMSAMRAPIEAARAWSSARRSMW
jgi:hypothetical protein